MISARWEGAVELESNDALVVLGGQWGVLGLTQWNTPPLREAAALGGVWLLGLLAVAVNVALTAVVAPPGGTRRYPAARREHCGCPAWGGGVGGWAYGT